MSFVKIKSRELIFDKFNDFVRHRKGIFLLYGKSGVGKTCLLEELSKKYNLVNLCDVFNDKDEFEAALKPHLNRGIILLDESGMYDEKSLELIRIYSDKMGFMMSSHKPLEVFKKEHFSSRVFTSIELKSLSLDELNDYLFVKFYFEFKKSELKFINKITHGSLRHIDKLMQSFSELKRFYKNKKSTKYILKLSAIENNLLG